MEGVQKNPCKDFLIVITSSILAIIFAGATSAAILCVHIVPLWEPKRSYFQPPLTMLQMKTVL